MYTRKVLVRREPNEELGIGVGLSSDKKKKVRFEPLYANLITRTIFTVTKLMFRLYEK